MLQDEYYSWKTCIEIVASLYGHSNKDSPLKRSVGENITDDNNTIIKHDIDSNNESACIIS
jgi:hypothetical protein